MLRSGGLSRTEGRLLRTAGGVRIAGRAGCLAIRKLPVPLGRAPAVLISFSAESGRAARTMEDKYLIDEASKALEHAHAPYSGIRVGASVLTESGEVFSACNVENASYGLTICAERAAMFSAVAHGHRHMKTLAVVAEGMDRPLPCGACLQVMSEFGVERVLIGNLGGTMETFEFSRLLPKPFRL